jgi:urea transport system permease protein
MYALGLDVVTSAAALFLVALGLLIVFGVMKVINLAQGAFLAVGGYSALLVTQLGWNPWLALVVAPVVGFVLGALIEVVVIRPLYSRPLDTILATWGLAIVITQLITLHFGRQVQSVTSPISGAMDFFDITYSSYRLFLVVVAISLGIGVAAVLHATRLGLLAKAVIMNEELARSLGINTELVRFATFGIGAALASLSGALITPLVSVDPNMGVPWLINAFMLVLVSGSIGGLALASLALGGCQVLVSTYGSPILGGVTIVVLAIILLRLRPSGFSRT